MLKLGVLASGRGSNFQSIIDSVGSGYLPAEVAVLITDNPDAYAIERARKSSIPHLVMKPGDYRSGEDYYAELAGELKDRGVELVILAGFMRVVKRPLIEEFPMRIMNIHPAILPAFPGLHGQRQAVDYGVKVSGCTVHFVDEGVDTGPIIVQAVVPVYHDDTEETLSERILKEEHRIFPFAVKLFAEERLRVGGRRVIVDNGHERNASVIINPPLDTGA
ncbi:phosphoribosylglycinamide formyltransferase [bacterium BMS3Bbin06]|nr:phosphoribosylglycinamide formyltransferase [bacterium BMS3Abin08]GBE34679.1 phosphoribosylglycinamide formyltransferase [bacterium BMS3Bbin06]HDO35456.1 phosphoribosylglycinamide formyltransferase [Nitrospirota bacterium]